MKRENLSGQTFNGWTVLEKAPSRKGDTYWACRCICGRENPVSTKGLKRNLSRSCGCAFGRERHGASNTREYAIFRHIIDRCTNPKNKDWNLYGGRGIKVEWETFSNFIEDIGMRPSELHSIDRIDSNGPYSRENCRWATAKEQARNISTNRMVSAQGKTLCIAEWAEVTGLSPCTIWQRINTLGWTNDEAVTLPLRTRLRR